MPLHRPCEDCGKRFFPTGRFNKKCEECRKNAILKRTAKGKKHRPLKMRKCPVCLRRFKSWKNNRKINCSKYCSRIYERVCKIVMRRYYALQKTMS